LKGTKEKKLILIFFLMVVSWVVCLLQDCVYLKLVVLHNVSYFMVVVITVVCLVSLDGVWQWFSLVKKVVGGIDEWECGKTYLTSCIS
jgi:hypothetical protein